MLVVVEKHCIVEIKARIVDLLIVFAAAAVLWRLSDRSASVRLLNDEAFLVIRSPDDFGR